MIVGEGYYHVNQLLKIYDSRYRCRYRLLSYLVYQDVNPSTQKYMIEGTGYYHVWDMIITRNIIVTYDSIVFKAYDVVSSGKISLAYLYLLSLLSLLSLRHDNNKEYDSKLL